MRQEMPSEAGAGVVAPRAERYDRPLYRRPRARRARNHARVRRHGRARRRNPAGSGLPYRCARLTRAARLLKRRYRRHWTRTPLIQVRFAAGTAPASATAPTARPAPLGRRGTAAPLGAVFVRRRSWQQRLDDGTRKWDRAALDRPLGAQGAEIDAIARAACRERRELRPAAQAHPQAGRPAAAHQATTCRSRAPRRRQDECVARSFQHPNVDLGRRPLQLPILRA